MRNFRGLTKDGKMVYGWLAEIEGEYFIIDIKAELRPLTAYGKYGKPGESWKEFFGTYGIAGFVKVILATVAQQVGKQDKNGKEIYEGDIVVITHWFVPTSDMYPERWLTNNPIVVELPEFYQYILNDEERDIDKENIYEIISPEVKENNNEISKR